MQMLGAKDVAAELDVSERTVTRMFKAGKLKAGRVNGKLWRIRRDLFEAYQAEHFGAAPAQRTLLRRVA